MFIGLNNAITGLTQDQLSKTINSLFSKNEQGIWYDPSDLSTLYQDAAGTTPVTGMEQPVGRMLDKSGRGNHATQTTTASRPVLSARYNLLTKTEQFDDAIWGKTHTTVTANAATDPIGGNTADKCIPTNTANQHSVDYSIGFVAAGTTHTFSVYAKSGEYSYLSLTRSDGTSYYIYAGFNLSTGVVNPASTGTCTMVPVGSGWYKCTVTATAATTSSHAFQIRGNPDSPIGSITAGDGTSGIYIWGADLRVANDGIGLPAYQRVNTATDYDTAGFPMYLRFDGVDDWLVTPSIDFTGTDKMTVFAGVRKLRDAAGFGCICELSVNASANNGTFAFHTPRFPSVANSVGLENRGTIQAAAYYVGALASTPSTFVAALAGNISGDSAILRLNGTQVAQSTADQGTGNYGNYPLYIGRRGGTSFPFNGQLYGLVIRGALSSTGEIQGSESYMNLHTGAY